MVNFEWYRSFMAVYRTGTVTAAADARALTQPAISQHIATLEAVMKQSLFQRTSRRMIPTEAGKQLYSRLAPAVDSLESLTQSLKTPLMSERPVLRVGAPTEYFGEAALARLCEAPLRLLVEPGDTETLISALSQGALDLVIATQHLNSKELDYTKIDAEEFCLVAPAQFDLPHPFSKKSKPERELENFLLGQEWVSYSADLPIIRRFWHIAFHRRPAIEPRMIVPNLLLVRKAVELGMGLSVLPRYLCKEAISENRIKVLWQPGTVMRNDLWAATRKVDRHRQEIRQVIELLDNLRD